ncbi:MAG TPA: hypothetical protein VGY57_13340 [Vicinamibacterales bacterium]|nr:hypothetical protein [Vicinamibacterales bacterium]
MHVEFLARGSARELSREIEAYALAQGHVSALVVPWESSPTTLNMAVTAVRGEGWAIEHSNLGTVTLTDTGGASTRIVVAGADGGPGADAARQKLAAVFDGFAKQLRTRFETTSDPRAAGGDPRGGQRSL